MHAHVTPPLLMYLLQALPSHWSPRAQPTRAQPTRASRTASSAPFSLFVRAHNLHAQHTRTQCTILPIHFAHRTRARSLLLALPAASSTLSSPHVVAFPHPYSSCCWYRDNLSATAAAQGSSCTYCPHTATTLRTKICSNPQQCSTNTTPIPSTQEEL